MTSRSEMPRFCRSLLLLAFVCTSALAQYFQHHVPASKKPVVELKYPYFAVGYSNESHTPLWSAMEIDHPKDPIVGCSRKNIKFATPKDDAVNPKITHADYSAEDSEGQVYSRGHMTPNSIVAYYFGCEAARTTFITTNIVPQLQKHNAGVWVALEASIAGQNQGDTFQGGLVQRTTHIWVFTGPVFWGPAKAIEKLGEAEIWIPTAIWKTVIWQVEMKDGKPEFRTCSWMIPHQANIPRSHFMEYTVSIRDIYKKTGVNVLGEGGSASPLYTAVDDQAFLDASQ